MDGFADSLRHKKDNRDLSGAIFKFATDKQVECSEIPLCGTGSNAVDAVKSEILQGFKSLKSKMSKYFKHIVKLTISKI
jgi:hypothetical protein